MSIRIALSHVTSYGYSQLCGLGPQVIRLRPAPHCRTPIESYSLRVSPDDHFLNWQQDPFGNFLARAVFPDKVDHLKIEVDLVAEMTVINPFEFFLTPEAEEYPFRYEESLRSDLKPYFVTEPIGQRLAEYLGRVDRRPRRTIDFLVEVNQQLQEHIDYTVRLEAGLQSCEETLALRRGACRDSSWLLVQILRHLGFAARFASGYLIQLKPDVVALDGPAGAAEDFTDLHAWTEVFLPGAGWVGLDPTSGLLAGEGHIPLACTPHPLTAAPITGTTEFASSDFDFEMSVTRVWEDPRVTKPYEEETWQQILKVGSQVDDRLQQGDVRLTMGGEPTFVSIDDMEGEEWQTAALGENKRRLADDLVERLTTRFASGGLLHHGQGKWYPGESLPRWSVACYWRKDGEPLWKNQQLQGREDAALGHTTEDAERFAESLARRLGVGDEFVIPAFEDVLYYVWKERRLPENVDLFDSKLEDEQERTRLARVFEQGITSAVGSVLPLDYQPWLNQPWRSGPWVVRADEMFLIPGDSPMGLRLPLQALIYEPVPEGQATEFPLDPLAARAPLPARSAFDRFVGAAQPEPVAVVAGQSKSAAFKRSGSGYGANGLAPDWDTGPGYTGPEHSEVSDQFDGVHHGDGQLVRTALCVEPRQGVLRVFLPPVDRLEGFIELIAAIEETAAELGTPVMVEGYSPPTDHRLQHFKVTPDPGVLEVNVQPAASWEELVDITTGIYEDARSSRLGTEKFDLDGAHTGTGGGNHVVLGGVTPADSPFLRRPDLLKSLVAYWHNHPSLSYLFSGKFIGPTSQAPRVDEGRRDATYELQIALEQIPDREACPPWLVDRVFRHLLVDGTGNTHRSEFCIDKLYAPETASGRQGLIEFRAFEMPPHARMSLSQQLLLRSLIARFWEKPYRSTLADWHTSLHDRFLLPFFVWQDFEDVIEETRLHEIPLEKEWFAPHFEFRFPQIGTMTHRGVTVELREAIEPWYVLGEEPAGGFTARYVDSSVERMQVRVEGMTEERYVITCNGRVVPLQPTGIEGEFVAGVRYRAWQPPSCLHPTIPVDEPLVFDVVDRWMGRSLGGCTYHVGHPGGLNPETYPVNAYEAESRRGSRYSHLQNSGRSIEIVPEPTNKKFPWTLDLRRNRNSKLR